MTPSNPLPDGKYKYDLGGGLNFAAMTCASGVIELYAASAEAGNNINVYSPTGELRAQTGGETIIAGISAIAAQYDNFVRVERYTMSSGNVDISKYELLN